MSSVVTKNPFDLLGNDQDEDGQPTAPPVDVADKPAARKGKRDAPTEAPTSSTRGGGSAVRGARGRGRGNATGSEGAFQDRSAGRSANRDKAPDDGLRRDRHANRLEGGRIQRGGSFDGRGGRGGAGGRGGRGGKDDRHSRTGIVDTNKQVAQGWGGDSGAGEWKDEQAGQQDAWTEEKAAGDTSTVPAPVDGDGFVPTTTGDDPDGPKEQVPEDEEADKSKSYEQYLAEQAEKRLTLGGSLEARKPNEGAKKQPTGKELQREQTEYFTGTAGKSKRERERKEKNQLLLDHDFAAREREAPRGGRGGRGRGRGESGFRGDGRGRGEGGGREDGGYRGGEGRGRSRGRGGPDFRGGRGGRGGASPNVTDMSAFPELGGN